MSETRDDAIQTPVVRNPPRRIWLNAGEIDGDIEFSELRSLACEGLTWCEDKVFDADVEYVLASDLAAARADVEALRYTVSQHRSIRADLDTLLARIQDDALAVSCQTLGQYREALLAREKEPPR